MSLRLLALLVALSAVPSLAGAGSPKKKDPAEGAYQQARRGYYALKDDPARRKFRHHWLAAVEKFQDVAARYPKSGRAADGLFTSAELLSDLSRVSLLDADLKAAMRAYERVLEEYPNSSLADDAALALARIHSDRLGHPDQALKVLERGAALGRGDRARELSALAAGLAPGKTLRFGPPEPVKKTAVAAKSTRSSTKPDARAASPEPPQVARAEQGAAKAEDPKPPEAEKAEAPTQVADANTTAPVAAGKSDRGATAPAESASRVGGGTEVAGRSSAGGGAEAAGSKPAAIASSTSGSSASDAPGAAEKPAPGVARATRPGSGQGGSSAGVAEAPASRAADRSPAVGSPPQAPARAGEAMAAVDPAGAHSEALSAAFERAVSRNEPAEVEAEPVAAATPVAESAGVAGTPAAPPAPERKADSTARLPKVAAHRSDGGVTLAEQLGLKIRRVVIDPGHGGHDSGAIGRKGTKEKDVALEVSKQVAELLRAEGLEVSLTRDDDRFVRLEDRAKFANEEKADLFISIHCNSAPNKKSRGIETYTLNTSADRYSIRLAARENASSERGVSDLQFILADLATKANTEESTRLANRVQANLVKHLSSKYSGVRDLGTKEALFYVLLGVRMPAILIETSFLSHPEEEKRLGSKGYQRDMARAIAAGVQDFLDHRGRLARVQ